MSMNEMSSVITILLIENKKNARIGTSGGSESAILI